MKLKGTLTPQKKSYDKPKQHIEKQRHYISDKFLHSRSYGFSINQVWMWELDRKESWALKNLCFWAVVLEKTLESLLDSKEIKPVNIKGNESWIFIGRTDAEAETPILWKRTQVRADFPSGRVWMWELDYIKKAEHRRIDAFELWCWRRLLRVPWTARRSSLSVLQDISPEYSL